MEERAVKAYIDAVRRRSRDIISITFVAALAAAAVSLFLPNVYRAQALVYVLSTEASTSFSPAGVSVDIQGGSSSREGVLTGFSGNIVGGGFSINAGEELAMSSEILRQLIDKVGLKNVKLEDLMKKRMVKAKLMEVYWGLSQRGYVPMIVLTTEAKQKKMAQALANTWAQLLADKINGISTFRLKEVYQFIVNESEASQNELSSKEAALAEFKKAAHMPLLELELKAREMDFYMYRRELNDIQTSSKTKGTQARDPEALKEREGLLAALADKSQKEISELQTKIVEAQQRSGQLQREVDTLRMNYELLQQKKVQFRISNVEGSTQARVVAWAAEPERHVRPKRFLITLIAGCAGLVGSALLIVFDAYRK